MCGICGIVGRESSRYNRPIKAMVDSIFHRGPDGSGVMSFNNALLGHTRLSIVDLEGGVQPMSNNNKSLAITFNGEIYGYLDIKRNLDYSFITKSDTEVVLALYEKHGFGMLDYLPGMFSFALWDEKNQTLFCARDRFGEKPFYYATNENNEFVFGSEIKAIIASGIVKPKLSNQALTQYLQRGYTGPDSTIYENIKSLLPAHYLVFKDGKVFTKRYWNYPEINRNISFKEAKETFYDKLNTAIKNQLIADVDVGSFLSGGIDSSSIVTLASKHKPSINTYSFGFQNEHNELPLAAETARKNKTTHHEIQELNVDVNEIILKLPDIYDEPFADSSSIPTYLICKKAREYNKVVLGGEGGDELLGGYTWWFNDLALMNDLKNSSFFDQTLINGFSAIEKVLSMSNISESSDWRKKRYLMNCNKKYNTLIDRFISIGHRYTNNDFSLLSLPDYQVALPNIQSDSNEMGNVFQYVIENYMAADILVKTDRAAMANSLELRSPMLDVDFATFCLSLPPEFKVDSKNSKIIFKEVMKNYLPDSIIQKKKQGFGAPNNWETTPSVQLLKREFIHDSSKKIFNYLPFKEVNAIIERNNNFWEFLVLSVWFEKNHIHI